MTLSVNLGLLLCLLAGCNNGSSGQGTGLGPTNSSSDSSTDPALAGDLATIQRAINDANPGDTVRIGAGSFAGRLVIRKSIVLLGEGELTELLGIAGRDDATIEVLEASDVTIADLKVSGPSEGVRVRSSTRVRLQGLTADGNGDQGIDVRQSTDVDVWSCASTGNFGDGIRVREGSTGIDVDDCLVERNLGRGLQVRDSVDVGIYRSQARDNREDGIRLRDSVAVQVVDNAVTANLEYGIRVLTTPINEQSLRDQNTITGNVEGDVRIEN